MKRIVLVLILVFASITAVANESAVYYAEADPVEKNNKGQFIDHYRYSVRAPLLIENATSRSLTTKNLVNGEVLKFSRKGSQNGLKKYSAKTKWTHFGTEHKTEYILVITDDLTKILMTENYQSGKEKSQTTANYLRGKVADCVSVNMNDICTGRYIAGPTNDLSYYTLRFHHYKAALVTSLITDRNGNPMVVVLNTGAAGADFHWAYSAIVLRDSFANSNHTCSNGYCIGQRVKSRIPGKSASLEGRIISIFDRGFVLDDHKIVFESGLNIGSNRLIAIDHAQ